MRSRDQSGTVAEISRVDAINLASSFITACKLSVVEIIFAEFSGPGIE
jgi:hypothetical protein